MIVLLSPAKIQNFKPQLQVKDFTIPEFMFHATKIMDVINKSTAIEIAKMLNISISMAQHVQNNHVQWNPKHHTPQAKQAAWVFNGEAYRGLNISTFSKDDITYAQSHFRIFSGLYGILRPLDLIMPYRLDVGDSLENLFTENLYDYWKKQITNTLIAMLNNLNEQPIMANLMSKEYAKLIDRKRIQADVIDFEFLEYQPDTERFKPIVVYIKKARGLMVSFILKNKITKIDDLKAFSDEGYWYNDQLSTQNNMVFTR